MTTPTCPLHGHPLRQTGSAVVDGQPVRYWGGCLGAGRAPVTCATHRDDPFATPRYCDCRAPLVSTCSYQTRTADTGYYMPSLFDASP